MREQIVQVLQTLNEEFGTSIFSNHQKFRAALADIPIESDAKKIRNLLNAAVCDMKAYSRLETGLANNPFLIDNLVAEMVSDYLIEKNAAQTAIESVAELLGYVPKPPVQPNPPVKQQIVAPQQIPQNPILVTSTDPLLKRVFMFLEDGDWKKADEYCERILDTDPENCIAYIGKLCAELKLDSNNSFDKIKEICTEQGDKETIKSLQDGLSELKNSNINLFNFIYLLILNNFPRHSEYKVKQIIEKIPPRRTKPNRERCIYEKIL